VGGVWGVGNLHGAAAAVASVAGVHPIVVTGRNESLRRRMLADRALAGATVLGFSSDIPALMAASDVLIQNAGGLTCLEGFAARLPVVVFDPLPGHGEDNCREMAAAGLVTVADDARRLRELLGGDRFWAGEAEQQAAQALQLFDRPCAADALAGQAEPAAVSPLAIVLRSVRPVLAAFSLIAMVTLTRAPALVAIHHLVR
jgi:UDP-N-acetylglucosamine:LPS N-acetylglucosamine transferase